MGINEKLDLVELELTKALIKIEKYEDVLTFYAKEENHKENKRSVINSEYYYSNVMEDSGDLAALILEEFK